MRYALRSARSLRALTLVLRAAVLGLLRLLLPRLLLPRLLPLLCLYILEVRGVALYAARALPLLPLLYSNGSLRAALALANERLENRGINIDRINIKVAILVLVRIKKGNLERLLRLIVRLNRMLVGDSVRSLNYILADYLEGRRFSRLL